MHYRSVADLNDSILQNLDKVPRDIDLVVGVPRSGLLAANLLCLAKNLPLADVEGFLEGRTLSNGKTRALKNGVLDFSALKNVLVIDDSVNTGGSMAEVRKKIQAVYPNLALTFCAVYGVEQKHRHIDVVLDTVPLPRLFQWNIWHHMDLSECCVDIDGVLCMDPRDEENDDGERYREFLVRAVPLMVPTIEVGALVTSRLEKYRTLTEQWMHDNGIKFKELHMLDLPSQKERQKLGAHGDF